MQYAILGNTGMPVSRLAFGTVTFTQGDKALKGLYKVGDQLADRLVGMAIDGGVTLFDSSDAYANGEAETLLGKALRPHRDNVVIATKVGARFPNTANLVQAGLSRRHLLWSVDQALKRLGTDWIDVYMAHVEDPYTPLEETLSAFDAIVKSGKARYIGVSNWSAWKVAAALEFQKANGLAPFCHVQMYYSLLGRDIERDFLAVMRRYGIGLTAWSPLAGGFLSGKYTPENLDDPDGRYSGFDILPFDKTHGFKLVERLRSIAAAHNASVAQVAIAWLLAKDYVNSILLGATKEAQLVDNLGAISVKLTAGEVAELDAMTALPPAYPNWYLEGGSDALVPKALRGEKLEAGGPSIAKS